MIIYFNNIVSFVIAVIASDLCGSAAIWPSAVIPTEAPNGGRNGGIPRQARDDSTESDYFVAPFSFLAMTSKLTPLFYKYFS